MNQGERTGGQQVSGIDRRRFLIGAAATATLVTAGCSSGDDGASGTTTTTTTRPGPKVRHRVELPENPFTLGVASGDPTADAVVIWTRLAPAPLAASGLGGMPAQDADVVWTVSTDRAGQEVVAEGVHTATTDDAHSVHVDVTGLQPDTTYWYRFRVGDHESPQGRTKTLPDGSPDQFGIAVVNCQMYENGAYAAYRHLLDEDVDVVAHLGDYIYELPGGTGDGRHSAPDRPLRELSDYRLRYASYKTDADLLAAHARFPFFVTWDDHEVANNYEGDTVPGDLPPEQVQQRKAAAYQAWWEHMPVRMDRPVDGALTVHRDLAAGDLARLYLLDHRQHGDEPPCRDSSEGATDYGNCAEVATEDRTPLGAEQEAWLGDALAGSTATWNLLGTPVGFSGIDAGKDEAAYYLDLWDGYPQARSRVIEQLKGVDNPVILSGDYHAGMVLDCHEVPFDQSTPVIATEFMAPAISSPLFDADVSGRTPQQQLQINQHGYLLVSVTPDRLTATFRVLDDVKDPDSGIETHSAWTVDAGTPTTTRTQP